MCHLCLYLYGLPPTTLTTFMKDAINNNLQFNGTDGSKETRIVQTSPDPMGGARSPSMRIAHGPTVALQHHRQMDCGWDGLIEWLANLVLYNHRRHSGISRPAG